MTVGDHAMTVSLISSVVISFSVSSSAVGWRRLVGGGIVISGVVVNRPSVCLRVLLRISHWTGY